MRSHLPPDSLEAIARTRLRAWIKSSGMTQRDLAARIGKEQGWVSRYLAGKFEADLITLQRLAAVFDHTVNALLLMPSDPNEARLIEMFRSLPPRSRSIALQLLEDWARHPAAAQRPARPARIKKARA